MLYSYTQTHMEREGQTDKQTRGRFPWKSSEQDKQ